MTSNWQLFHWQYLLKDNFDMNKLVRKIYYTIGKSVSHISLSIFLGTYFLEEKKYFSKKNLKGFIFESLKGFILIQIWISQV